jgi:hypothetical protein
MQFGFADHISASFFLCRFPITSRPPVLPLLRIETGPIFEPLLEAQFVVAATLGLEQEPSKSLLLIGGRLVAITFCRLSPCQFLPHRGLPSREPLTVLWNWSHAKPFPHGVMPADSPRKRYQRKGESHRRRYRKGEPFAAGCGFDGMQ